MITETQITASKRWTREPPSQSGHGGWVEVDCFLFQNPDGSHSDADILSPEQLEIFERQEAARLLEGPKS